MAGGLELRPFTPDLLCAVEPWFDHPEVRRRLGDRTWPARELDLVRTTPGTEYRGQRMLARHNWVGYAGPDPVGLVGGEVYDRWLAFGDGDGPDDGPVVVATDERVSFSPALVVDPARWGRGHGRALLGALLRLPELADVALFGAGVEPDNSASVACLEAAGYRRRSPEPDQQGMLYYFRAR